MKTELENILSKLEELAEQEAAAEAAAYYHTGGIYFNFADFREYVLIKIGTLAHFQTSDGYSLFIPSGSLGSFLPDVASDGL